MNTYKTHNVCSRSIEFEVENDIAISRLQI